MFGKKNHPSEHKRHLKSNRFKKMRGKTITVNKGIHNAQYRSMIRGTPVRKVPKRLRPFSDYDKDGVQNWFDCRPFDKTKQDAQEELAVAQLKQAGYSNQQISKRTGYSESKVEQILVRLRAVQDSLVGSRGTNRYYAGRY